jgi:DNA-binding MarR family transcriptional regulator
MGDEARRERLLAELDEVHAQLKRVGMRSRIASRADFALTPQQLRVVGLLALNGPMRSSELATALDVTRATVTGLLDRLEQGGLIIRRTDPRDGRSRLAESTERARRTLSAMLSSMDLVPDKIISLLTPDELDCLLTGLRAILRAASRVEDESVAG